MGAPDLGYQQTNTEINGQLEKGLESRTTGMQLAFRAHLIRTNWRIDRLPEDLWTFLTRPGAV